MQSHGIKERTTMTSFSKTIASARSRARSRGAALVEAAVVLPVMVAMLGLSMMMYQAYSTKLVSNQQIRSEVLDYASHNCKSQTITYSGNSKGGGSVATGQGGVGSNDSISGGAVGASGGSAKTSGIMAKSEVSYTEKNINNPKPSAALKGKGLNLKVNGEKSTALCNEEPEDGNIGGVFSYAKNKLSSIL
jgi:hypothetical protein